MTMACWRCLTRGLSWSRLRRWARYSDKQSALRACYITWYLKTSCAGSSHKLNAAIRLSSYPTQTNVHQRQLQATASRTAHPSGHALWGILTPARFFPERLCLLGYVCVTAPLWWVGKRGAMNMSMLQYQVEFTASVARACGTQASRRRQQHKTRITGPNV